MLMFLKVMDKCKSYVRQFDNDLEKKGNVVLMEVNNKERTEWPIGAIEKIYPGKDGIVRVAMIKTKHGNFLRPVQ
ncbi:hypothetical protein LAZ67_10002328 [Cordylochernes scorpioides]|uniref:DUF5641 domain-containing protein n=1 Tax=Cordylochernes scorpioides TaxID=51811 RepID=A0ABY6KWJ3_9ARAC|nr:hypothetical protein LAZ67_10002328 [Cordylochernes scorpioides]